MNASPNNSKRVCIREECEMTKTRSFQGITFHRFIVVLIKHAAAEMKQTAPGYSARREREREAKAGKGNRFEKKIVERKKAIDD